MRRNPPPLEREMDWPARLVSRLLPKVIEFHVVCELKTLISSPMKYCRYQTDECLLSFLVELMWFAYNYIAGVL